MENRFHTVKFWGGKDKVQTVEYIAVSAVQEWIGERQTIVDGRVIVSSKLLTELEIFLSEK